MAIDFASMDHPHYMREALKEADLAAQTGELPIGAVIVHHNTIVGRGRAQHIARSSNVAHAEMNALVQAEQYLFTKHRDGFVIYTTVEPCVMCLGAIVMSNIDHVVYGLADNWIKPKGMLDIDYVRLRIGNYLGGVLADDCLKLFQVYRPQDIPLLLEGKWVR
jgi:tRNA(adenine34) deaminase